MKKFQSYISKIPKWTDEELNTECDRIIQLSKCDWIEYLITVVFVTHAKIRASIKDDNISYKNITIDVPEKNNFIHKCYIEFARKIWKNAYLYDDENITDSEYQRNIRDIETLLGDAIDITIRQSLPIKNLLQEYLGTDIRTLSARDEDVTSMSAMNDANIQNLIKKELEEIKHDLNVISETNEDTNEDTNTNGFAKLVIDNSKIVESAPKSTPESTPELIVDSEPKELEPKTPETPETPETPNVSPRESIKESPKVQENTKNALDINRLDELMKDTERKISKQSEVDIDILSVSDMPKINKNSNSIKQQLNDSQNYSMASSRRQKKYSTFMFKN